MTQQRMLALAEKILEKTKQGLLNWEKGIFRGSFETSINENIILIRPTTDEESYSLEIYNRNRDMLDSMRGFPSNADVSSYQRLYNLYELAKKQTLNVDESFDAIMAALDALTDH